MSITDPIADFLTVVRNASKAKKDTVDCPSSKIKEQIAVLLKKEGYIRNFKKVEDKKQGLLRIYLKYSSDKNKKAAITNLQKISKPGLRIYKKSDEIKPVFSEIGIAVVSTSKGIKTDKECRDIGIGGEIICKVW
ncbi:MAG: 30S ribosomal protein S8 [Candidatus Omnitrophota bacterium]